MSLTGIGEVAGLALEAVRTFFPNKSEQEQREMALTLTVIQGQTDINKIEAASPSLFKSGWRPGAGWVCVIGLALQFIVAPLLSWGTRLYGHPVDLPPLDIEFLMTLLVPLLGLGAYRTAERLKGKA